MNAAAPEGPGPGPLVSVVLTTHNCERYVTEAVESVLAQTYSPLECIAVDDGSHDDTPQLLERYDDVRLIRRIPAGGSPGATRNAGAAVARGPLITFLDGDDAWRPERVQRMVARLQAQDVDAVVSATTVVDEGGTPQTTVSMQEPPGLGPLLLWQAPAVSTGTNLLMRRECFDALGGWDERFPISQDWEMLIRLIDRFRVAYEPEKLSLYRVHPTNISRTTDVMARDMVILYDELFAEWGDRPELMALRRRAYAALHRVLAGSYFARRRPRGFLSHTARSIAWHPAALRYFLAFPQRRARGRRGLPLPGSPPEA